MYDLKYNKKSIKIIFQKNWQESVPLTISYHLSFLRISKIWSMQHQESVGRVRNKEP